MSWNITSSIASSDALIFSGGAHTRPLTVVRRATARGLRLVVDPRDATVRLTLPQRGAIRPALKWVAGKRGWVEAELARLPTPQPIVPGMTIPLRGHQVMLEWSAAGGRTIRLEGDRLFVGGPRDRLAGRVLRFLRTFALDVLTHESRSLATMHDLPIGGVGVGDPKARWGSCSARGDIRYSWRLILAPDFVRRATVAHEVAHLRHMNHGERFHALVADLSSGAAVPARAWLRANGNALHWFGRAD